MPPDALLASFERAVQETDLALIEGAMGLYDGVDLEGSSSTAQLSRLLQAPIVLVVNTARMTRSVAAMVAGYQHFESGVNIAGVILNNVSPRSRHEHMLTAAVERFCGIPVLGSLPRDDALDITQRYLGLIPYGEEEHTVSIIDHIRRTVEARLDLDAILHIARHAPPRQSTGVSSPAPVAHIARVGVIRDRVFTFYYPENLEALCQAGAELVYIDSIRDRRLPPIDGLYIGGGFPELFMGELEANATLRQDIARAIDDGLPTYAECAGLMYLCRSIHWRDKRSEMVGTFPCEVDMRQEPVGHGYTEVEVIADNPFFPVGLKLRGHEFHHSRLTNLSNGKLAYRMRRGHGLDGIGDAMIYKNTLAAYTHLHAVGSPQWAPAFLALASRRG